MVFLVLFLIPAIIAVVCFVFTKSTITLKEFGVHLFIQGLIAGASMGIIYLQNTSDTQIINGQVTSKSKDIVSCSHSYECNCFNICSGSGSDEVCTRQCSTCYDHSYDVDWSVHSDIGSLEISRVDSQGLTMPERWNKVKVGEPFSKASSFTNYIKASPDTLFRHQGLIQKYQPSLPAYPSNVFDYYRINRVVVVGGTVSDLSLWNDQLSEIAKNLGPLKQVNLVVVLVFDKPREYFYALEQHWIGAKKNDVVLVIGTNNQKSIEWVDVMAWTDNTLFKIQLRDNILDQKVLDRSKVLSSLSDEVSKGYKRKSMKDFKYLEASITPSLTEWIVSLLVGILASIGVAVFLMKNDLFNEEQF